MTDRTRDRRTAAASETSRLPASLASAFGKPFAGSLAGAFAKPFAASLAGAFAKPFPASLTGAFAKPFPRILTGPLVGGLLTTARTGILATLLLLVTQLGCTGQVASPGPPTVVVSVSPLAYFAKRIAGDALHISTLVPPGTDPHHFEPSMSQLLDLDRAVLYLEIGHPRLEFETLLKHRHFDDHPDLPVLSLSDTLEMMAEDPHVWTSPRAARSIARTVAAQLRDLVPHDTGMGLRLAELLSDIDAVDQKFRRWSSQPGATRTFVSHHPAWGYLARDYDLQQTAIQVDHAEPSAARLAQIIEQSRRAGVQIVLVQPGFSVQSARAVAKEIGAEVVAVDPLGADWFAELNRLADAFVTAEASRARRQDGTP